MKASSLLYNVIINEGGNGNYIHTLPKWPGGNGLLSTSIITTLNPGLGLVALPGFDGNVCKSLKLQLIIQPVSVYQ